MNKLVLLSIVLLVSLGTVPPASAYVFMLDNLSIEKNGSAFFNDSFDDGAPPPSSPSGPNTYNVFGSVGPEVNGKLTLDSKDAARGVNSRGEAELVQSIRGNSGINGTDPGFYLGDSVLVSIIYDLILPDELREFYGVRFSDRATGIGLPGNDLPQLRVLRLLGSDVLGIQFVNASFEDQTFDLISQAILEINHDQIVLTLDLEPTGFVTASYAYLDNGVSGPAVSLPGEAEIFRGEEWTRVEILAQKIPEPASLWLIGIGLAAFGRRR